MSPMPRDTDNTNPSYTDPVYSPESVLVIVCSTLALFNSIELLSLIFMTFKRRSGLYFWSILHASFGGDSILRWVDDRLLRLYPRLCGHDYRRCWLDPVISGQSVVLYSRLHLVLMTPGSSGQCYG
ncbi:hypothetical protein BKA56DRAFT_183805 [Ilyonectria sp. MPI-CAGE-AT-0026]|nr:hypothetical protein BKA56DRAFT_183805 [Ilyonectria sp. MPI-CAGE-AT-0026]